jgi:quinol-cytochrome oxidoreductase complex cytochrome b subunit/cytochrome c551/c552
VREIDKSNEGQGTVSLGLVILWVALLAAITGVVLLLFYRASAAGAHASVQAMQDSFPLMIVRRAHHWASALLIVGGGAYLLRGLFSGSYRRPLHLAWIAAVGMVCLFLLFQVTGHLLPWDSAAVRTAAIETGIAENMPMIGHIQARILRGGDAVGAQTLPIWFLAHVLFLPTILAGLACLFIRSLRRNGFRIAVKPPLIALATAAMVIPALLLPAPVGAPATPADYRSYDALPEWYVLPLHSLVRIAQNIHPGLAFLGTAVVPGLALAALLALPWIERKLHVRFVRIVAAIGFAGFLGLCLLSAKDVAPLTAREIGAQAETRPVRSVSIGDPAAIARGGAVFEKAGCTSCHAVGSAGAAVGPALDGEGKRHPDQDWQLRHLKSPSSVVRGSTMPSFNGLSDEDLSSLAAFLLSL